MKGKSPPIAWREHVTFNNCLPAIAVPISPILDTCEACAVDPEEFDNDRSRVAGFRSYSYPTGTIPRVGDPAPVLECSF
jgi:hypothetical protein